MKKDLWVRLDQYHFKHLVSTHLWDHIISIFGAENASTKSFADKLVRKLNWQMPFALRAIGEYKKFVYLGITGGFEVTPSKVIDQVWHEHQLFTKAYRQFCAEVLHQNFDHNPELIPVKSETGVFEAQYLATLKLYEHEFGVAPPADIWIIPKFKPGILRAEVYKPRLKSRVPSPVTSGLHATPIPNVVVVDDRPLFRMFMDNDENPTPEQGFHGFGGGDSGGAGATVSFEASESASHSQGNADSSDHSSTSDSSSDSSCGGGSSCSSSSCGSSCGGS